MSGATQVLPFGPMAGTSPVIEPSSGRFTLDGDAGLEAHLAGIGDLVRTGVERIVPRPWLDGVLLGGGYGRGEGGVLCTPEGDQPYNDLEFYVLVRGSTVFNSWRYRSKLEALAHALSGPARVEVEFKVISVADLQRRPVTMFSYDLMRGHRRLCGPATLLNGCAHHGRAGDIPLAEATRLLMNRGTGLLFAREHLDHNPFTAADADFVERNLAKAKLALGDAVLTACGRYHWSCRERARRLAALNPGEGMGWLESVRLEHAEGVEFKLWPHRTDRTAGKLEKDFVRIALLMRRVWLWLERRRLGTNFLSPIDYALHPASKCPDTPVWRNCLVNARLGVRALCSFNVFRYPRERLLRALPVLLWQPGTLGDARVRRCLQRELRVAGGDEAGLLAAYTQLWQVFR